jgi:hypothetical protein
MRHYAEISIFSSRVGDQALVDAISAWDAE